MRSLASGTRRRSRASRASSGFSRCPATEGGAPASLGTEERALDGATCTIRTVNRGGEVWQAYFNEHYLISDREHLLSGLGVRR